MYNPTNNAVSLSNWSLKRKTLQTATSTENLVLKFSATSTIAAKSFFLIEHNDYNGTSTPDFRYTNNSDPLAYSDDVVILYNNNGEIIDEVAYQNIPAGKSLERKAFYNNQCATASGSGEFLGNGCDRGYMTMTMTTTLPILKFATYLNLKILKVCPNREPRPRSLPISLWIIILARRL